MHTLIWREYKFISNEIKLNFWRLIVYYTIDCSRNVFDIIYNYTIISNIRKQQTTFLLSLDTAQIICYDNVLVGFRDFLKTT